MECPASDCAGASGARAAKLRLLRQTHPTGAPACTASGTRVPRLLAPQPLSAVPLIQHPTCCAEAPAAVCSMLCFVCTGGIVFTGRYSRHAVHQACPSRGSGLTPACCWLGLEGHACASRQL